VVWCLWLLIQNTRHGLVPWRTAIRLAIAPTLLAVAGPLLAFQLVWKDYPTAIPLEAYRAVTLTVLGMSLILGFLMMAGATALIASAFPRAVYAGRAPHRRMYGADAAAAVAAAIGLGLFANRMGAWLIDRFHAQALLSISSPDLIASAAPAVAALAGAVRSTVLTAAVVGALALLWRRLPRRWMRGPALLLAPFASLPSGIQTPGEFALHYGVALLAVACALAFCLWFARENYLAYALVLWFMALRPALSELFGNANPSLHAQGRMVAGVLALSLVWAVSPAIGRGPRAETAVP